MFSCHQPNINFQNWEDLCTMGLIIVNNMIKEQSDLVASWRVELWRLARLVPWSLYPRVPLGGAQGGGRLHHLHHHHHVSLNTMMKVFSGPPNVVFTWRHWGHLEGSFQDNQVGGILHHVASKSNLKSARAQRLPTLNGNYSNSHLEHGFPTHTEAHCHLKQSGHIQESWRLLILCLEVPINLLARQSSIWSVLIERGHLFIEVSQGHGEKVEMFGLGRCFLFSILTIPPVIVSQNRTQWGPEGSKDGDILRPRNIYQGRHLFSSLPYSLLCFILT